MIYLDTDSGWARAAVSHHAGRVTQGLPDISETKRSRGRRIHIRCALLLSASQSVVDQGWGPAVNDIEMTLSQETAALPDAFIRFAVLV